MGQSKLSTTVRDPLATPSKPLILCVEDDEIQRQLLRRILEPEGFAVLEATTGAEGLRLFRDNPVSLIIIDERLGKGQMTGTELTRAVKAIRPTVPVVLRSGYAPESIGSWDCFVEKGESTASFLKTVHDLIKPNPE